MLLTKNKNNVGFEMRTEGKEVHDPLFETGTPFKCAFIHIAIIFYKISGTQLEK